MNALRKTVDFIENQQISLQSWLMGVVFVLFGRYLLENLSSRDGLHTLVTGSQTLVHYSLCFVTIAVTFTFVVSLLVGAKKMIAHKVILFGMVLVWLAPILDLVIARGQPRAMTYIMVAPRQLLIDYLTFFGPLLRQGITLGMRIEIVVILAFILSYIFIKTKSWIRAVIGVLACYTVLFIYGSLPSLAFLIAKPWLPAHDYLATTLSFMQNSISDSLIPSTFLHPTIGAVSPMRLVEIYFDVSMSQIYYIILLAILPLLFFLFYRRQTVAILKNTRPMRAFHYFLMIGIGLLLAVQAGTVPLHASWLTVVSFIILFATYYCAWAAAVCTNDIHDLDVDKISNSDRPLARGVVTVEEMRSAGFLFIVMALVGGFVLGSYIFYLVLAYLALSYVYSVPPLRLHQVPFLSHFIIALACLSAALSGFYMIAADKTVDAFPLSAAAAILICFTLFSQTKDIKDVAGDHADGIHTLPTLLGDRRGKMAIATLNSVGLFIIPLIFARPNFFFVTIPAILVQWFLIMRKPFVEKYLFYLYFLTTIAIVLIALFIK